MNRRQRIISGYVRMSSRRPFVLLFVYIALTALAGWGLANLDVHMDLKKLLPQDTASVQALDEMEARRGSSDLYTIAIESPCARANAAFVEDLQRRIESGWDEVVWVQTDEDPSFFRDHALLYLPVHRLEEFRSELNAALRCEMQRVNPAFVEVGDACSDEIRDWRVDAWVGSDLIRELGLPEEFFGEWEDEIQAVEPSPEGGTGQEIANPQGAEAAQEIGPAQAMSEGTGQAMDGAEGTGDALVATVAEPAAGVSRFCSPDEENTLPEDLKHFIVSDDGRIIVMYVQLDQPSTDVRFANRMEARGRALIAELDPTRYHPEMRAEVVGAYQSANEAREAVNDSTSAFIASAFLVVLIMFLFFRTLRALLMVLLPLIMGIGWTMGLTALTYGELNLYTMFVGSVLVGMGIDYGIHLYGRAMEGFREGKSWEDSLVVALTKMFPALMAAALTTIGGFCTLLVSHFQGFIEFGVIASYGIGLCVIACFLVIPPLVFGLEAFWPLKREMAHQEDPTPVLRSVRVFAALALAGMVASLFLPWTSDPETGASIVPVGGEGSPHPNLFLYVAPAFLTGIGALLNTLLRWRLLTAVILVLSVLAAAGWALTGHEMGGAGHEGGYWLYLAAVALALTAAFMSTKGLMSTLKVMTVLALSIAVVSLFLPWSSRPDLSFVEGPFYGTHGGSPALGVTLLPSMFGAVILWLADRRKDRIFWPVVAMFLGFLGIGLWMFLDLILPGPDKQSGFWLFLAASAIVGLGGILATVRSGNNRAWLAPMVATGLLLATALSLAPGAEFEYDFRNLRGPSSRAGIRYGRAVGQSRSTSASVILGSDLDQMREVHELLRQRFSARTTLRCEDGDYVKAQDNSYRAPGISCTATAGPHGTLVMSCPGGGVIPVDESESLAQGEICVVEEGGPDPMLKGFLTIETYVPDDQEARLEAICGIAREINRAGPLDPPELQACPTEPKRALNRLTGEARDFVDVLRRLVQVEPFTLDDIPDWALRTLTEKDGSVGRIGLVFRRLQEWNVIEVTEYQNRYAQLEVPSGKVHLADANFITSDVIWTVQGDGKRMGLLVVAVLVLVMMLLLRSVSGTLLCLAAMLGAFGLTVGFMVATGTRLGMYNMIVIPAVLGVSIDGAIYLYSRNKELRGKSINQVMTTTGVAVAASSLTTVGGFAGLLFQRHMGIQSIGQLAIIGILSALVSVFLLLPGLLLLFQKHNGRSKKKPAEVATSGAQEEEPGKESMQ